MNTPLVSVIIPIKNRVHVLERAVQSVYRQTYPNIEIIIVDDGSDEDIEAKVEELRNTSTPIKYLRQKNTGPGIARRNGLYQSKGKYIQYLDSDDELLPDKILHQVEVLEKNPDVVMVYGDSMQNGDRNKIHRKSFEKKDIDDLLQCALEKRRWHTSACLWNYGKIDEYWDNLKNGEDVLHDVTVGVKVGTKIMHIDKIVCNINFDSKDPAHLSNYHLQNERVSQIVENAIKLNEEAYRKVLIAGLNKKKYLEPLAERYFYEALKFSKFKYVPESIDMLKKSLKITTSLIKKLEIHLAIFIVSKLNNNFKLIKTLFRLHTLVLPPRIHQFRKIASYLVLLNAFAEI